MMGAHRAGGEHGPCAPPAGGRTYIRSSRWELLSIYIELGVSCLGTRSHRIGWVKKGWGGVWRHPQPKARARVRADTPVWSQHTPAATSRSQLVLEPGERWPSASGRPSRCPLPCHPNAVRHAHRYLPSPPVLRLAEVPPPLCGSHGGAPRSIVGACPAHRVLCARERADERRRREQQRRPQQRNLPCERGRVRPQCPGPAAGSTQVRRLASRAGRWDELKIPGTPATES